MRQRILSILFVVIALIVIAIVYKYDLLHIQSKNIQSSIIKTVRVDKVDLSNSALIIPLIGRVNANQSVNITSEVTARIKKIGFNSAQAVKKGSLLIELENSIQKSKLKEAQINLDNELRKLNISHKLMKKGALSLDSYEQLKASVESLKAVVEIRKGELEERSIYAPFDGVLGLHDLTVGKLVKPGTVLFQLDDLKRVYVDFVLPEKYLSKIVLGQKVYATTDVWEGKRFLGIIKSIDTHIDDSTLSFKLRVYFDNKNLMLLDGMMVKLNLNLSSEKLPMIPLKSVVYIGDERYVYVLGKDDIVNRVKVSLGTVNGTNIAVKRGLQLDSLIVVEGAENLNDNDKVKVLNKTDSIINNDVPLKRKKKNNEVSKLQNSVDKEG